MYGMDDKSGKGRTALTRILAVTELAELIISGLDSKEDLFSLRLVSRRLNSLSLKLVYRSIHLDLSWQEVLRTVRIVEFLGSKPECLGLVHDLSVSFGPNAFNADSKEFRYRCSISKEFRYRCSIVLKLVHQLHQLRSFKWQTKDTIPEDLLIVLKTHPNKPALELRQEISSNHQSFPPFQQLMQMAALRTLRLHFNLNDPQADTWLYELVEGSFEVISTYMGQLEELDIHIFGSFNPPMFGDRIGPDLTQELNRGAGSLSLLRKLSIKSNEWLFSTRNNQPTGLYCLLHYSYPALQSLNLEFPGHPGMSLFWRKLAMEPLSLKPVQLRHLQVGMRTDLGNDALEAFLYSFAGLETIKMIDVKRTWQDEGFRKAIYHHHESLNHLTVIPSPSCKFLTLWNGDQAGETSPSEICAALPQLREFGFGLNGEEDLVGLQALDVLPVRVFHLYLQGSITSSKTGASRSGHKSSPYTGPWSGDYESLHSAISEIMSVQSCLERVVVFRQHLESSSPPEHHIAYTICKDSRSGELTWRDHLHEAQDREMKRWAEELDKQYKPVEDENARAEYRQGLEFALFPAYQKAIEAVGDD